ncbi:DUF4199 domain-containing protein [uncultured Croceitalea sp.]|uniref:DUF4199 domain-containing protein n=1 Tax=uncultured Croceitalea sp. TaxID=1798908 RepID=UPI00330623F0
MEENKLKSRKYALKFGVIAGAISLVFSLMLFFQEMHYEQNTVATIVGISILFAVIAFGINQYKKDNEGFLKLGQAIKLGTGIALVAGLIGLVYYGLLSNDIIEPGFTEKAVAIAKEKTFADNPNLTQEQWDQGLEMQNKFKFLAYPLILVFNAILGLIAGLVFGLIMKKDKSTY